MITIVGGTYDEVCFEPSWKEVYGSGLRAVRAIQALQPDLPLLFFTFADQRKTSFLHQIKIGSPNLDLAISIIPRSVLFQYDHPLRVPQVFPRPDVLNSSSNYMSVEGTQVLYYGMIEGHASIVGDRVVYDPQSPVKPLLFSATGSKARELVYVVNLSEAKKLTQNNDLKEIKQFFFQKESAAVLVLKMGAKGALVALPDGTEQQIPVYQTDQVWPIGSGDIFAATFAYYWFKNSDAIAAANQASWLTACYCSSKSFQFLVSGSDRSITPLAITNVPTQKVYLAGPFFTYAQRWLIDQVRTIFKEMHLNIFSPWHDVGHGLASEVVSKDLEALDESGIIFAVLDGLDSGTLFEIGYAVSKGIPVIGYVENESSESVKMLEGTNCVLERDLTTAIYKCYWKLAHHE